MLIFFCSDYYNSSINAKVLLKKVLILYFYINYIYFFTVTTTTVLLSATVWFGVARSEITTILLSKKQKSLSGKLWRKSEKFLIVYRYLKYFWILNIWNYITFSDITLTRIITYIYYLLLIIVFIIYLLLVIVINY